MLSPAFPLALPHLLPCPLPPALRHLLYRLLRYNDTLRSHPSYVAGAKGAIEIYLRLHDDPSSIQPPALTNGEAEEERKRLEEEEKRVREKKEREEKDRLEAERIEREKKLSKQVAKDKGKKGEFTCLLPRLFERLLTVLSRSRRQEARTREGGRRRARLRPGPSGSATPQG